MSSWYLYFLNLHSPFLLGNKHYWHLLTFWKNDLITLAKNRFALQNTSTGTPRNKKNICNISFIDQTSSKSSGQHQNNV